MSGDHTAEPWPLDCKMRGRGDLLTNPRDGGVFEYIANRRRTSLAVNFCAGFGDSFLTSTDLRQIADTLKIREALHCDAVAAVLHLLDHVEKINPRMPLGAGFAAEMESRTKAVRKIFKRLSP